MSITNRNAWELDLVERPFCQQLQAMGWTWLEGDVDVAELTERANFREILLKDRLRAAIRRINPGPDGKPWLDDTRLDQAIRALEQLGAHGLMESNQSATNLLLKGTSVDGLPSWNDGRNQPVRFIDFDNPANNDFLVINQFKVVLTSGQGHVIPDAVLFVNGIPLVLAELKSPGIEEPMAAAISQLLRYTNQRKELYPTHYTENEGVERLFHYNQFLIASHFFEARVGTIGALPEAYLEWADTSPVPMSRVAEELGKVERVKDEEADAEAELLHAGPNRGERPGVPLLFRGRVKPLLPIEADTEAPAPPVPAPAVKLRSQELLVAGMLRPEHLLDIIRNFSVFQQVDGKTRKIVTRYQQFRAVHKATHKLLTGKTAKQNDGRDDRGGIVWHTQGSGKSLTMAFLVRKMRAVERLRRYKIVVVTDRTQLEDQLGETASLSGETVRPSDHDRRIGGRETPTAMTQRILAEQSPDIVLAMIQKYQDQSDDGGEKVSMTIVKREKTPGKDRAIVEKELTITEDISFEEFPVLNESEDVLVLVDEAHRGHARKLHRNLRRALPNAAIIGFTGTPILSHEKTETREIFGDFIDRYLLKDAEYDGATVPIFYEGRTADGIVQDAPSLDALFEDLFRDYTKQELEIIKAKYGTKGDILEAPLLIAKKAQDMVRHYAAVVLPEGFKAQVVASSRDAAITYHTKLKDALGELIAELEAVPAPLLSLSPEELAKHDDATQWRVTVHPQLPRLKALETAVVISAEHNDPESWKAWSDKGKQEKRIERFKRRFSTNSTEKSDPLSILVVNNMLLTGFDAPVEQVMYLDRRVVAHDLLQAIARVNRTNGPKKCGYVIDYVGVARHLSEGAKAYYDGQDIAGSMIDIKQALPALLDRRDRAVAVFRDRGITDLKSQVQDCVFLLEDLPIRADFMNRVREFYDLLNMIAHRPEVPANVFRDANLLGFINKVAANLYRDPGLNLLGVAEKVKALIDKHVSANGVDPKIPPIAITDADFEARLTAQGNSRARAAEMQHAARYHIVGFSTHNPAYARRMSEKLEELLKQFKDDWDALERELRKLIDELRVGDRNDFPGLDPRAQVPFVRLMLDEAAKHSAVDDAARKRVMETTIDMVERIRQEISRVGFWKNAHARELLTKQLVRDLDRLRSEIPPNQHRDLAQRLVALAKENHEHLKR